MFTGIIEATSTVIRANESRGVKQVEIKRPKSFTELKTGDSIACDGICLTVIAFGTESFKVEIMRETAKKTTAAHWNTNTLLNLERALQLGGRLDGHWLQGHVDTTARLLQTRTEGSTLYLRYELHPGDAHLVVPQGSIAINGVSLTLAAVEANSFSVALISHTLDNTNLSKLPLGAEVNLEYDILGKYIARLQKFPKEQDKLDLQGF